jgi:phosphatidate cytidylyltransferase
VSEITAAIYSPIYQQTVLTVLAVLFSSAAFIFLFRKKNYYFVVSWASIKSWLFFAPLLFLLLGLPNPWPFFFITMMGIYGAKIFFQLMGIYHRNYFVLICYFGIIGLGLAAYYDRHDLYNLLPMIVLGLSCFVPLLRNNYKRMIQYISLTNLCFVFLGWSLMHLALILKLEQGIYQLMYLIILTEFCDNTNLAISRYLGGKRLFDRIDHRRTWRGTFVSILITFALAFAMRHLLPEDSKYYWLTTAAIASLGGVFGDMLMIVIRRDAGIKVVGAFVLGRGDILHRMDRMIFVAPIYYYVMLVLPYLIDLYFTTG